MTNTQTRQLADVKVLLVEDNPADAQLARLALRSPGSEVGEIVEVGTLAGALEVLNREDVDLVLLDLGLPDTCGFEGLDFILLTAPTVPVIVLTGAEDTQIGVESIRHGAGDYLQKGNLSDESLRRAIRYSIERSRLHRRERFLSAAARVLGSSLDLDRSLEQLASLSASDLADSCAIDLFNEEGTVEKRIASRPTPGGTPAARAIDPHALPAGLDLIARSGPRYRPALHHRREMDGGDGPKPGVPDGVRSLMALPLTAQDELLGILILAARVREFTADDLVLGERFADLAAATIHNARSYQAATEAIRSREQILGLVAHDLRNPLGTISLATDILLDMKMDEAQKVKQLNLIRRSAKRMNRLIEDLLDIARIQNNRLTLELDYHPPRELIREAIESQAALAAGKKLSLTADVRTHDPVLADAGRILRVLANLIGNAIKFTPEGGGVVVGVERRGQSLHFTVTDTGIGIPPEEVPMMFKPFWQGRNKAGDGAGLGLSIARGIVEAHGGQIAVESRVGEGTRIGFSLPAAPERRGRE